MEKVTWICSDREHSQGAEVLTSRLGPVQTLNANCEAMRCRRGDTRPGGTMVTRLGRRFTRPWMPRPGRSQLSPRDPTDGAIPSSPMRSVEASESY